MAEKLSKLNSEDYKTVANALFALSKVVEKPSEMVERVVRMTASPNPQMLVAVAR